MDRISAGVTYRFGEFEVDVLGYELRRSGHRIRLARQPMDLLLLLLDARGNSSPARK
jgi:DNA-binding winged helix-turn-helix (wHTH) protein